MFVDPEAGTRELQHVEANVFGEFGLYDAVLFERFVESRFHPDVERRQKVSLAAFTFSSLQNISMFCGRGQFIFFW